MIYALIASLIIIVILLVVVIILKKQVNIQVEVNRQQTVINTQLEKKGEELKQRNDLVKQENEEIEKRIAGLKTSIQAQENILKSISATNATMRAEAQQQAEAIRAEARLQAESMREESRRQSDLMKAQSEEQQKQIALAQQQANEIAQNSIENAKKQAEEAYKTRFEALAASYEQKEKEYKDKYEQVIAALNRSMLVEKDKLEDLEAKQRAYYEAQKRAQEIEEQKDYYRLVLSEFDLSDVFLLRDLQKKFTKKEVIDKMIWETYYRPAFDALTGRILPGEKVSGIYKITSLLTNQAYIGQSVDIKERFRQHIKTGLSCSIVTNKLYQEMYKQGPENFTYEILEQVPKEKLNERETYWIEFYKTKEIGLNVTRGGA